MTSSSIPLKRRFCSEIGLDDGMDQCWPTKRPKHETVALVCKYPNHETLAKYLSILDKRQLVEIVLHLARDPLLGSKVACAIPYPTALAVESHLTALLNRLFAAFPYIRGGPNYSDYSFNRVRPVIEEFKNSLIGFLDYFTYPGRLQSSEDAVQVFDALFNFLVVSCCAVTRLPDWETIENNHIKSNLYSKILLKWQSALHVLCARMTQENLCIPTTCAEKWLQLHIDASRNSYGKVEPVVKMFCQLFGQFQLPRQGFLE